MTTRQSLRADFAAISLGACSLALILGALAFQYLGGLAPCEMCHWQRWPHIAAAIIGLVGGGFLPRRYGAPVVMATILLILTSGFIGLYQTGMQYGLLPGPKACTVTHAFILGAPTPPPPGFFESLFSGYGEGVRCDIPTWFFLGLAMPAWNAIISFTLAIWALVMLVRGGDAEKA